MIDMSIGKLLVLALIILVVWYGFKYVSRVEALRQDLARRGAGAAVAAMAAAILVGAGAPRQKPVEDSGQMPEMRRVRRRRGHRQLRQVRLSLGRVIRC